MRTKRPARSRSLWSCIFLLCLSAAPLSAEQSGLFTYSVVGDTVRIDAYPRDEVGHVEIPAEIDGKPVTRIASTAFNQCAGITGVTIPEGVESIEGAGWESFSIFIDWPGAFYGCSSLTSITIPSTLIDFGSGSLEGCSNLESILVHPDNPAYTSIDGVLFDASRTLLVCYPEGRAGPYVIPDGVIEIGGERLVNPHRGEGVGAFVNCEGLTSITIPESVSSIAPRALNGCSNLTTAIFLGDAPHDLYQVFDFSDEDFTIRYLSTSTGFTSPTWQGYPSQAIDESAYPAARWLLSHGLPHETDLHQDLNGDGVSLLMAYALDLDPDQNLQGSLPVPVLGDDSLSISCHAASAGITYTVQTSTDLKSWTTEGVTLSELDPSGQRTASVEIDGAQRFMRLLVAAE